MRSLAALALALGFSAAACQLIWSYDDLKDQPATGGGGGARSSSSSSRASSSGASSSSSSGAVCPLGGPPDAGACADENDCGAIVFHQDRIQDDVKTCTVATAGLANPACIAGDDGLSAACAGCWATVGVCGEQKCPGECAVGMVDSAACNDCLHKFCDCAFKACSGIIRPAMLDGGVDAPCD